MLSTQGMEEKPHETIKKLDENFRIILCIISLHIKMSYLRMFKVPASFLTLNSITLLHVIFPRCILNSIHIIRKYYQ